MDNLSRYKLMSKISTLAMYNFSDKELIALQVELTNKLNEVNDEIDSRIIESYVDSLSGEM